MQTLQIKQLSPNATLPTRTHTTDAGLDIYAAEDTLVVTGTKVPTGVAVNIPEGYEGTIRPRSGKTSKTNLRVQIGTIDSGYIGELSVICDCTDNIDLDNENREIKKLAYKVEAGEKIAQLVIAPIVTPQLEIVDQFDTQSAKGSEVLTRCIPSYAWFGRHKY